MAKLLFTIVVLLPDLKVVEWLIDGLETQTFPQDRFECLIITRETSDNFSEFTKNATKLNLRTVSIPAEVGFSQAKNIGYQQSYGEIVIFLAGNALPAPDWLENYHDAFTKKRLAVVAGSQYSLKLTATQLCQLSASIEKNSSHTSINHILKEQFPELDNYLLLAEASKENRLEREVREVYQIYPDSLLCCAAFSSSNVAVDRDFLIATKGFLPGLTDLADVEMGLQLWEAGARFGFADGASCYHIGTLEENNSHANINEVQVIFYRHPYTLVLKLLLSIYANGENVAQTPWSEWVSRKPDLADIAAQYLKISGQPLPVDCRYSVDELIDYFYENTGVSRELLKKYLEIGLNQGLIVKEQAGQYFFDRYHTSNWLQNNTAFKQHELLRQYCHITKTPAQTAGQPVAPLSLSCRGLYEIVISAQTLTKFGSKAILNLPLPIEHRCQTGVKILSSFPENLLKYANYTQGMIIGLPLNLMEQPEIHIGYQFECEIHEFQSESHSLTAAELAPFLKLNFPADYLTKAKILLKKILVEPMDDYVTAQLIYHWMLDNIHFAEGAFPGNFIFDAGMGTCIQWTKMFITLCRLAGVGAREQCGAILLRSPFSPDFYQTLTSNRSYNPFMHTWAEFYDHHQGWLPVDFFGAGLGSRILTTKNILDESVRRQVIADTPVFDKYYFGNLDPFRIYASERANKLPTYPIITACKDPEAIIQVLWQTHHQLSCTLSSSVPLI